MLKHLTIVKCVFACRRDANTQMHTSGEPQLLFSLGDQPLTGRQSEHSKQKGGSLNWPLTRSCRQVVVAKRTVSVSAHWAHCGPQAAALQDMSSVSLCQYWPICMFSHNIYLYCDVCLFPSGNYTFHQCGDLNFMGLRDRKKLNINPVIVNLITAAKTHSKTLSKWEWENTLGLKKMALKF